MIDYPTPRDDAPCPTCQQREWIGECPHRGRTMLPTPRDPAPPDGLPERWRREREAFERNKSLPCRMPDQLPSECPRCLRTPEQSCGAERVWREGVGLEAIEEIARLTRERDKAAARVAKLESSDDRLRLLAQRYGATSAADQMRKERDEAVARAARLKETLRGLAETAKEIMPDVHPLGRHDLTHHVHAAEALLKEEGGKRR